MKTYLPHSSLLSPDNDVGARTRNKKKGLKFADPWTSFQVAITATVGRR
jgi:hypothetical protein